jgi:exonuclease SbcC
MKIQEIVWKNFGSYGNNLQKVSFEEQGNFYLVLGSNGAGKSTISDVIKFGLYGKVDGKKLRDLPNRFNGNLWVKITLEKSGGSLVVIERGASPSILRVSVNGVLYDQAGKKNVQEYLEEEILSMPYYVFNNMVSLSINDFKSFVSMGVADKRMIIDRLFGLEAIGSARLRIKALTKSVKEEVDSLDREIAVFEKMINSSLRELESLNEKLKSASEEKKQDLASKVESLQQFLEKAKIKFQEISEKESEVNQTIRDWNEIEQKKKTEIHVYKEKISLYEKGKCPTCEADLSSDYYQSLHAEFIKNRETLSQELVEIAGHLQELRNRKNKIKEALTDINNKKASASSQITSLQSELKKLDSNSSEQANSLESVVEDGKNKKEEVANKKKQEEKKANFYKIVEEVFGDRGVKSLAIKKIMPILNSEIRKVLLELNMEYRVSFDQEFEVDIQHLGFKVSPDQLSTGERKKVDFATLVALIRLLKSKFGGLNIIFLDEIFSSIDGEGIHNILVVLSKTSKELGLNIFVINHSQLPTEIFDYRVEISKNSGFSNLMLERVR